MAILKVDWPTASTPSYTPDIENDYNAQNENIERSSRGYNAVSLTNFDGTTTAPQVALGSVIEANGSFYDVTSDTAIGTSGATSGTIYLSFDDSAMAFEWVDTAPTWSDTLNGWYISGDRFTGHLCEWDGATSFTEKYEYYRNTINGDQFLVSVDGIIPTGTDVYEGTYGSQSLTASGGVWVPPAGAYMIAGAVDTSVQVYTGSSWVGPAVGSPNEGSANGFFVTDGVNYRIYNTDSAINTVYYRKIW